MIKAKITVFDDETGRVYEENRLVVPDTVIPIPGCKTNTAYYFCFGVTVHENQETIDYSQRGCVFCKEHNRETCVGCRYFVL